jgi:hypothetical protein
VLHRKCLKTAKQWANTWKRATLGENEQVSLNVMPTRTLPRVTPETPENGYAMGKKVETGDDGRKWASAS